MNSPHPLAAWVERNQKARRRETRPVRYADAQEGAVRRSRGRSVFPLQRGPLD
ncbi:MAG TPA: hypothetical protein VFG72_06855 [Marmoricola sp.]|nr:hypothetical protein [Marmoricola sp.]